MRRLGLEVGCERIAHTGNRQAHRARRDNRRIHQDDIGVCLKEEVLIELAVIGVKHRKCRARCIALGALAVKVLKQQLGLGLGKAALDLGTDALLARRRHDDEDLSAERLDIGAELGELVRTLDVLAGAIENCSHNYPIL